MKRFLFASAMLALLLCVAGQAKAGSVTYNYDFANYYGESLSSLPGVGFSLNGGPGPGGTPYVGSFGNAAMGNSPTGNYPTSEQLVFSFTSPASGVNFSFDNYGDSFYGRGASYYYAYDASNNLVSSGFLGADGYSVTPVLVSGSNIATLVLDNGTGGTDSWEFGVYSLGFTEGAAATPEPASLTLLGLGALSLAGYGYRRRKAAAV